MKIKRERKFSFFQITVFVATCFFIIFSIILAGLIIKRKTEIDDLKKKNQQILESSISQLINDSPELF